MRIAAVVALAGMLGCATGGNKISWGVTGLVASTPLIVAVARCNSITWECDVDRRFLLPPAAVLATAGVVATWAGIVQLGHDHERAKADAARAAIEAQRAAVERQERGTREVIPIPTTADPILRQLTLEARVAARHHQCAAARLPAELARTRDPAFFRDELATDPWVAACLATPAP